MNIISEKNIEKAKILVKKSGNDSIVLANDDKFNRKLLEYGKFRILLSPEKGFRNSKLRQIDSGLNHVLAKIASKNNVAIGINLEEIKNLGKKEKAERLSKIIQNIRICRKTNTKLAVKNRNRRESAIFLLSLGSSTAQVREALYF